MNRIDTNRIFNFVADGHECLAFGNSYESAALAAKFKIDIRPIRKIRSSNITNSQLKMLFLCQISQMET